MLIITIAFCLTAIAVFCMLHYGSQLQLGPSISLTLVGVSLIGSLVLGIVQLGWLF